VAFERLLLDLDCVAFGLELLADRLLVAFDRLLLLDLD